MAGLADKFASFSLTQLNGLLEDDEQLHKIVTELEEVQQVQQSKEMTLASNRRLAEQNLQLQPQLDCQKNELTKRYRQLQEVFELYQLHKSTLDVTSPLPPTKYCGTLDEEAAPAVPFLGPANIQLLYRLQRLSGSFFQLFIIH